MKKSQKDIQTPVTGSNSAEIDNESDSKEGAESLLDVLMDRLMETQMFEDELVALSEKPITMLMPRGDKKRFFLFSPVLNIYRDVGSPTEAIIIEESNGKETLCIINNIPFLVPDEYLINVGYN